MATETQTNHGEPAAAEFDREISFWGTLSTGIGILLVTVAAMILMWFFSGYLRDSIRAKDLPLTAVQQEAQRRVEEANRLHEQLERRRLPALEWPLYAPQPPQPQLQVAPWMDLREFLQDEWRILGDYTWVNRRAGVARVPIARAMSQLEKEGVPPMLAPLPEEPTATGEQVPSVSPGAPRGPEGP